SAPARQAVRQRSLVVDDVDIEFGVVATDQAQQRAVPGTKSVSGPRRRYDACRKAHQHAEEYQRRDRLQQRALGGIAHMRYRLQALLEPGRKAACGAELRGCQQRGGEQDTSECGPAGPRPRHDCDERVSARAGQPSQDTWTREQKPTAGEQQPQRENHGLLRAIRRRAFRSATDSSALSCSAKCTNVAAGSVLESSASRISSATYCSRLDVGRYR